MTLPIVNIQEETREGLAFIFFIWDYKEKTIISSGSPDLLPVGAHKEEASPLVVPIIEKLERAFDKEVYNQDFDFCMDREKGFWYRVQSSRVQNTPYHHTSVAISLTDISRQKQMNERLKKENNEILNLARTIIHDVKNPLMTIQNVGRLLELEGENGKKDNFNAYVSLISTVSSQATQMANRMGELLVYIADKKEITLSPLSAFLEMEAFVAEKRQVHSDRIIKSYIAEEAKELRVLSNHKALRTIFEQLLDNALKYSQADEPITFTLTYEDEHVVFRCIDEGIGVPSLQAVKFLQKLPATSRLGLKGEKGHGIGLPIVKKLTEYMEGHLTFESEDDEGTTVSVMLPVLPRS